MIYPPAQPDSCSAPDGCRPASSKETERRAKESAGRLMAVRLRPAEMLDDLSLRSSSARYDPEPCRHNQGEPTPVLLPYLQKRKAGIPAESVPCW